MCTDRFRYTTRKHSSRMRTARFQPYVFLWSCHQMSVPVGDGVGPQVNKFEQVTSDCNQMPLAGEAGPVDPMPHVWDGGVCTVRFQ